MTVDQSIQTAFGHHRAGRSREAERICREVLSQCPDHPEALHLLGILEAQAGRLDIAVDRIRRAVRLRPEFADAWQNLGCVLVNQGRTRDAIAAYQELQRLRPADFVPHYALGLLFSGLGQLDQAVTAFGKATQLKPDHAEAQLKLGMALRSLGRLDDAITAYAHAIALKPDFAEAHNNLANAFRDQGRLDKAIVEYGRSLRIKPDDVATHLNLGNMFIQMERFAEAAAAYERVLRVRSDCLEAQHQLGWALANLQRFDEAMVWHRRAVAQQPADAAAHEVMGASLLLQHDVAGAAACFRRAAELEPGRVSSWNGLGAAARALGHFDEAQAHFRRAAELGGHDAKIHRNMVSVGPSKSDDNAIQQLTQLLNQPGLSVQDCIGAGFALGKLLDDADRYDDAFAQYARANSLYRQSRAASGDRFDAGQSRCAVDGMIETFTPLFFESRQGGEPSELPVFIVGMPRSGTSLVEQIAASHPNVVGAGELPDIANIAATLKSKPCATTSLDIPSVARASASHLQRLQRLGGGALRVIDKMPGNVLHLSLVAAMFPSARVIFCRRDARDTCLSCYFQCFANKGLLFTYDLADCAQYHNEIERLTVHWHRTLPLRMLDVQYEQLVADLEGQSRRLIEFLGLPWHPACLDFHRTERPVLTASAWQVRQPIYSRSVGRWLHYERHLGPLLKTLDLGGVGQ